MKKINRIKTVKFLTPLFFMLCFSGNPLFVAMSYSKPLLVLYSLVFIIYSVTNIRRSIIMNNIDKVIITIIIILTLTLAQYGKFNYVSIPGVVALILKIVLGWFTYLYYNNKKINFLELYVRMLVILTILAFPFWILNQFITWGFQLDNLTLKTNLFYTVFPNEQNESYFLIRNSGMFWEPGAFAGYLIMALLFIVILNRKFTIGKFKNEFLILSIGLISTQSTTGYILYGILIVCHFGFNYDIFKFVFLPIIFLIATMIYTDVSFLNNKINDQFDTAYNQEKSEVSDTRFGSLVMDLQYFYSSPIIGNGLNDKTRFRFHPWVKEDIGHGNGMSNFIVLWGLPFFVYWLYSLYLFIYSEVTNKILTYTILLFFILMMLGEQFLNFPLFLLFFTLPLKFNNLNRIKRQLK